MELGLAMQPDAAMLATQNMRATFVAESPSTDGWCPGSRDWAAVDERLARVYKSVLAADFARANRMQPTTDQGPAHPASGGWDADRIEAALLNASPDGRPTSQGEIAGALACLALDLVVPRDLAEVPVEKIIRIRQRHGAEFMAFGATVDQVAAELRDLIDVRDTAVLTRYLESVVAERFARPRDELRKHSRRSGSMRRPWLSTSRPRSLPGLPSWAAAHHLPGTR
ncbi:DUF6236 family protein [Kitasatospora sp. NPDC049258]|uniref:DUF6236 family protein n=1 Tax=Kitasatospora sp. NPDC049258 TaxID=3155394 RepID=UPI00342E8520